MGLCHARDIGSHAPLFSLACVVKDWGGWGRGYCRGMQCKDAPNVHNVGKGWSTYSTHPYFFLGGANMAFYTNMYVEFWSPIHNSKAWIKIRFVQICRCIHSVCSQKVVMNCFPESQTSIKFTFFYVVYNKGANTLSRKKNCPKVEIYRIVEPYNASRRAGSNEDTQCFQCTLCTCNIFYGQTLQMHDFL